MLSHDKLSVIYVNVLGDLNLSKNVLHSKLAIPVAFQIFLNSQSNR